MPTQKPVAVPDEAGRLVLRSRPKLEFDREQVALALAVVYGAPRAKVGPTNIPAALHQLVTMALGGEDITASESTVAAWRQRLVDWEVWPADG